jgi:hypothetical protein
MTLQGHPTGWQYAHGSTLLLLFFSPPSLTEAPWGGAQSEVGARERERAVLVEAVQETLREMASVKMAPLDPTSALSLNVEREIAAPLGDDALDELRDQGQVSLPPPGVEGEESEMDRESNCYGQTTPDVHAALRFWRSW